MRSAVRGGFGTKVHLVCDRRGLILAVFVTAGQRHESKAFEPVMLRRAARGCRDASVGRRVGG